MNEPDVSPGASVLATLIADLTAEQRSLDDVVASLDDEQWRLATASPGWTVADQLGHLAYFDAAAVTAIERPEVFAAAAKELLRGALTGGLDDVTLHSFRALTPRAQLDAWRRHRHELARAARTLREGARVPWYGPPMGTNSFLSARLMETWAHGVDVRDAVGAPRDASDRLRHVAQLGFNTRNWSYVVRGERAPEGDVALHLTGPDGAIWKWGEDARDTIRGSAEEFCLVVTQRRHVADTTLETGDLGAHWLERAQAFAGAPSKGPAPRGKPWPSS